MKTLCIKSNNDKIIDYLLDNYTQINLDYVYVSNNCFKIYENIIIHYTGNDIKKFQNYFCKILTDCIIKFYEFKIVKSIINYNYFYFSDFDKKNIFSLCNSSLSFDPSLKYRKNEIYNSIFTYINENKSIVLDGFVNFRLKKYIKILDGLVDECVNNFLIEKEYLEFIQILKIYVSSSPSKSSSVHLVYSKNNEAILYDENINLIPTNDDIFNAKYLSDITFSANDYVLNTLLNIAPQKIIIHLDNDNYNKHDDFINTIKLIFTNKVVFCNEKLIENNKR